MVARQKEEDVFDDQQLSNFGGRYDEWKGTPVILFHSEPGTS
jgi:hypothetical protein